MGPPASTSPNPLHPLNPHFLHMNPENSTEFNTPECRRQLSVFPYQSAYRPLFQMWDAGLPTILEDSSHNYSYNGTRDRRRKPSVVSVLSIETSLEMAGRSNSLPTGFVAAY